MSRIRTIKPEFFRHEELFEAEKSSGFPLRVAFPALWTVADREGRFRWKPRNLKLDCLPFDEVDFDAVLESLCANGFIVKYQVDGELYGYIPSFSEHQVFNIREPSSKLPAPSLHGTGTVPAQCQASREGKGRELEREGNISSLRSDIESSLRSDSSQKNPPKLKPKPVEILQTAVSEKTARDIIDHRKAKRAPLTPRAAELLVAAFRDHGDCEEAAAAMIVNGWQGFKPEWIANQARAGPNGNGRSNGNEGFVKSVLQDIENDRQRGEKSSAKIVPMLQLERK